MFILLEVWAHVRTHTSTHKHTHFAGNPAQSIRVFKKKAFYEIV